VRFDGAARVFSTVFGVVYCSCFYFNLPMFNFDPETNTFAVRGVAEGTTPIFWFGWIATATLVSGAAALVLPSRLTSRLPSILPSALTVVVIAGILWFEKRWFL
jgi:hypothetical protein